MLDPDGAVTCEGCGSTATEPSSGRVRAAVAPPTTRARALRVTFADTIISS